MTTGVAASPRQRVLSVAALTDGDPAPGPRSRRDRVVDATMIVVSAGLGAFFYVTAVAVTTVDLPPWTGALDWSLGVVGIASLWWRRRWPVGVGLLTAALSTVSASCSAASAAALFTAAVHRRWPAVVAVAIVNVATGLVSTLYRPQDLAFVWEVALNLAATGGVVAWGMYVRARRQLVVSLRERAERAEHEQQVLADRARMAERTRIAREMHDVLAHRISLVALHAGGLQVRPDLPAEEVRRTAELLRSTAHSALEELRGVIGVLRDGAKPGDATDGDAPAAPQPVLRDIARLVEETRAAGTRIEFTMRVPEGCAPPGSIGRDAYRIVQEALTNVAKHARGTATVVEVDGAPGSDLRLRVRNRLPFEAPTVPAIPGSGSGLVGLQERVTLAGGTLRHGPTADGDFEVEALLGWPA